MPAKPKKPEPAATPIQRFRIGGTLYTFDWSRFMLSEARFLDRSLSLSMDQWLKGLSQVNPDCVGVLYGLLLHRADPEGVDLKTLDFETLDFDMATFDILDAEDEAVDPTPKAESDSSATTPPAAA